MLSRLIISIIFLCLMFSSNAAHACMMSAKERESLFKQFDSNTDGLVSLEEYVLYEGNRSKHIDGQGIVDQEHLKRDYEYMDDKNRGFIMLDQFYPPTRPRCM